MNPEQTWKWIKEHMKQEWKLAFLSALILGLLIHMPVMLSDIPNHDGLDSMYFDQNMITSGRWFLTVACGISSYYTLPWLIGLLSVFYLALTSVVLTEFLQVKNKASIVVISGLLVSFPSIASTFAYVFTMDGYMLALLLAVISVLLTQRFRLGFLAGAVCLACSMGTYQAYLPFAVLLCIYGILTIAIGEGSIAGKIEKGLKYLYMGMLGVGLYYVLLQMLLKIQNKELASYQGINGMASLEGAGLLQTVKQIYSDFVSFTLKGNVLWNNIYSGAAVVLLVLLVAVTLIRLVVYRKWWKNPWFYFIMILLAAGLPVATNLILIISPKVTYHLLMRYQWVLYLICMLAFVEKYGSRKPVCSWGMLVAAGVLLFNYTVTDQIGYSNLQKRYEKTYAYCVRMLDRIEQTEGYYQGIPIAMIGVVGDREYPQTDITGSVTGGMIGLSGDTLVYTGRNYQAFIRHYLGATLNILPAEAMEEAYYEDFYVKMPGFPAEGSIQIVDGIMYIKTENTQ